MEPMATLETTIFPIGVSHMGGTSTIFRPKELWHYTYHLLLNPIKIHLDPMKSPQNPMNPAKIQLNPVKTW